MAKEDTPPKVWTPDQPIEDDDDETETQRRFRAERRLKYLHEEADKVSKKKPDEKEKKKSGLW